MDRFWPLLVDVTIEPIVDSVYPVEKANEAHEYMTANRNTGKIILRVR